MKKAILASTALALALGMSSTVLADEHPGNSEPGGDRYAEIAANPNPDAQCGTGAGSGAFGYLGKDLNPSDPTLFGNDGKPGVFGKTRTGPNNSAVCGSVPD